jgi:hypothetical protein
MNSSSHLHIKQFNIKNININSYKSKIIIIGNHQTGKTTIVKDILYHNRDIPLGTIISCIKKDQQIYSSIVHDQMIHQSYNKRIIENVVNRQQQITKLQYDEKKYTCSSNIDPRAFLIMDDCLYDNSWTKNKNIRCLIMNEYFLQILLIITMQYSLNIPPTIRTNFNYIFICGNTSLSNRKRIFNNFASEFSTFEIFCEVLDQCTTNYECLVIDNASSSNNIEDRIFWYKAKQHVHFTMNKICNDNDYSNIEQQQHSTYVECPICFEKYKTDDQRYLMKYCIHTICKKCKSDGNIMKCPLCRCRFHYIS